MAKSKREPVIERARKIAALMREAREAPQRRALDAEGEIFGMLPAFIEDVIGAHEAIEHIVDTFALHNAPLLMGDSVQSRALALAVDRYIYWSESMSLVERRSAIERQRHDIKVEVEVDASKLFDKG